MEKISGLICTNYETRELGVLTEDRTIAALPFGGRYRMIDFPLSNMVNSGIGTVGLITPYKYRSLFDHVGAGKEWSLDRKTGGLFILPGSTFGVAGHRSRFLLRDLRRNEVFLKRSQADYVVLTSADAIYNMDYRPMVEQHERSGADLTMLCYEAPSGNAYDFGLILEGESVRGFTRGVRAGEPAFCACFVLHRSMLLQVLDWYANVSHLDFFEALESDLDQMDVRFYRCPGYFRKILDINDYYLRSMELLRPEVQEELHNRKHPILTKVRDSVPTKYLDGSNVKNSLVAAGCVVRGTVENSILFRSVQVGEGAVIRDSVILQSCEIGAGASVANAVIDRSNVISAKTVLQGSPDNVFVLGKKKI